MHLNIVCEMAAILSSMQGENELTMFCEASDTITAFSVQCYIKYNRHLVERLSSFIADLFVTCFAWNEH